MFSSPYESLSLVPNENFVLFEKDFFGDNNLRLAKMYYIYIEYEDKIISFEPGFMGQGLWSDNESAMEVSKKIIVIFSTFVKWPFLTKGHT